MFTNVFVELICSKNLIDILELSGNPWSVLGTWTCIFSALLKFGNISVCTQFKN